MSSPTKQRKLVAENPTLVDRVRAGALVTSKTLPPVLTGALRNAISHAVVFDVTNFMDTDAPVPSAESLGRLRLPYPGVSFEVKGAGALRGGCVVFPSEGGDRSPEATPALEVVFVVGRADRWEVAIDDSLTVLLDKEYRFASVARRAFESTSVLGEQDMLFLRAVLSAISVLNCRNAQVQTHEPPAARNVSRAREGRPALVTYKTLTIESAAKARPPQEDPEGSHASPAQHSRRGHYREYPNGLFNNPKLAGCWYFGPTIIGTHENGTVTKDYVLAP